MKYLLLLVSMAAFAQDAPSVPVPETKAVGIVPMTQPEIDELKDAVRAIQEAQSAFNAVCKRITQRAVDTFNGGNPSSPGAGCTETRAGSLESGQVVIRSTKVCSGK